MASQVQMPGSKKSQNVVEIAAVTVAPVLWVTLVICGMPWRVWITNQKFHKELTDEHNGYCIPDKAEIYIHADVDDARKGEVLVHELMHAWYFTIGYEFTVAKFIENQKLDAEEREEARISAISHIVFDTFLRNGMLVIPPIPPEAALLKTAA